MRCQWITHWRTWNSHALEISIHIQKVPKTYQDYVNCNALQCKHYGYVCKYTQCCAWHVFNEPFACFCERWASIAGVSDSGGFAEGSLCFESFEETGIDLKGKNTRFYANYAHLVTKTRQALTHQSSFRECLHLNDEHKKSVRKVKNKHKVHSAIWSSQHFLKELLNSYPSNILHFCLTLKTKRLKRFKRCFVHLLFTLCANVVSIQCSYTAYLNSFGIILFQLEAVRFGDKNRTAMWQIRQWQVYANQICHNNATNPNDFLERIFKPVLFWNKTYSLPTVQLVLIYSADKNDRKAFYPIMY